MSLYCGMRRFLNQRNTAMMCSAYPIVHLAEPMIKYVQVHPSFFGQVVVEAHGMGDQSREVEWILSRSNHQRLQYSVPFAFAQKRNVTRSFLFLRPPTEWVGQRLLGVGGSTNHTCRH